MKALVFNGKVVDLSEEPFSVTPELKWIDVPCDCRVEAGWFYDGQQFSNPKPSMPEIYAALFVELEHTKQAYLDSRYPLPTILWLIGYERNLVNPKVGRDKVVEVWSWMNTVLEYFFDVVGKIKAGTVSSLENVNFTQFDATDPCVSVYWLRSIQ